jgi:large subunit ribosomal protein L25
MITDITVQAESREGLGKGPSRRLRADGRIPITVYGEGEECFSASIVAKDIANILRSESGHNTILKVAFPGKEPSLVIIKDWQTDPVRGRILHADLKRLSMTTATQVSVPVHLIGEAVGVKLGGGLLEILIREIDVECLPGDIPSGVDVDVSGLQIGDHVRVKDLIYDRTKVTMIPPEEQIVASVLAPRLIEEVAPAAAAEEGTAEAEPEVIKKGKAEEAE